MSYTPYLVAGYEFLAPLSPNTQGLPIVNPNGGVIPFNVEDYQFVTIMLNNMQIESILTCEQLEDVRTQNFYDNCIVNTISGKEYRLFNVDAETVRSVLFPSS